MNAIESLPGEFELELNFLSDWHIGSGLAQPGHVDSLVARDEDDLPFVPAKTLTGIWRDSAEQVAWAFDNDLEEQGKPRLWEEWVKYLFGCQPALKKSATESAPVGAALSIRPARLPEDVRGQLTGQSESARLFRQALTFIKPGVAIDSRTGRAKDDFLRFEEMMPSKLKLNASVSLHMPEDDAMRKAMTILLVISAGRIERLGGKRRRGSGAVKVEIKNSPPNPDLRAWYSDLKLPAPPVGQGPAEVVLDKHLPSATSEEEWVTVPLELELMTPLLVPSRTVGNVVESLDYLPGTYLLPIVARTLRENGFNPDEAIASGEIQVLAATPDVGNERGIPAPFIFYHEKRKEGFSDGNQAVNGFLAAHEPGFKNVRAGFIGVSETAEGMLPGYAKSLQTLRTHNTIKDEVQRPTSDVGGVYSYQALSKGMRLRSSVRLSSTIAAAMQEANTDWWQGLSGNKRLGRSKKDDYGQVKITARPVEKDLSPAPELLDVTHSHLTPRSLLVWCESDVILLDQTLQPDPSPARLAELIGNHIGTKLEVKRSVVRHRRLDSWHVSWGLPRPSLIAIAAGSCIHLEAVEGESLDRERLAALQRAGVGRRTAEGFGRISFNRWVLSTDMKNFEVRRSNGVLEESNSAPAPSDESAAVLMRIEEAAWKKRISEEVLRGMNEESFRGEALGFKGKKPSATQAAGMANIFKEIFSDEDKRWAMEWINHLEDTKNRRDKWPLGALGKLKNLITDEELVWKHLDAKKWRVLTGSANQVKRRLWPFALRAFLDAGVRAHKRKLEGRD